MAQNDIASGMRASIGGGGSTIEAAVQKYAFGILPHQFSRPSMAAIAVGRHPCRPLAARVRLAARPGSALALRGLGARWRPRSFSRASMPGPMVFAVPEASVLNVSNREPNSTSCRDPPATVLPLLHN